MLTSLWHINKSKVGHLVGTARPRKRSRWSLAAQSNDKGYEGLEALNNGTEATRSLEHEGRQKKGISNSSNNLSSEKLKECRVDVPLTSMAAHVVDEEIEIELDDKIETPHAENENEVAFKAKGFPLLLPPVLPPSGKNYSQYEGDDENVDVDGLEEAAIAQVDI